MANSRTFKPDKRSKDNDSPSNGERANAAAITLAHHRQIKNGNPLEDESDLRDLLTDLMHLADKHGWNFTEELKSARMNYNAER